MPRLVASANVRSLSSTCSSARCRCHGHAVRRQAAAVPQNRHDRALGHRDGERVVVLTQLGAEPVDEGGLVAKRIGVDRAGLRIAAVAGQRLTDYLPRHARATHGDPAIERSTAPRVDRRREPARHAPKTHGQLMASDCECSIRATWPFPGTNRLFSLHLVAPRCARNGSAWEMPWPPHQPSWPWPRLGENAVSCRADRAPSPLRRHSSR